MIDSFEMLVALLPSGNVREHRYANVELAESWDQSRGKKVSAHANALADQAFPVDVSWLVVGVRDCGVLCGKSEEWARGEEQRVSAHLRQYLDPFRAVRNIRCYETQTGWVVVLELGSPDAVTLWNKRAYKLQGTSTSEMSPDEFMGLTIRLPGSSDFSRQDWDGPVDASLAKRYGELVALKVGEHILGDTRTLTGLGVLDRLGLSGKMAARILFGDFEYRVIRYDFEGEVVENEVARGLARLLFPETRHALQSYACLYEDPRLPLFGKTHLHEVRVGCPEDGLAEALANAVAHAAHFERGGELVIEVSPDRIAVSNLCVRESAYFANRWFSKDRFTINPFLMGALRMGPFVDELGLGKRKIYRASVISGKRPPIAEIEQAGRMCRWRLTLFGGASNHLVVRLREQLVALYEDERKSLIALALVLWRDKSIEEIRGFLDEESRELVSEIIEDPRGPVLFLTGNEQLFLARWVRVLLGEGKDTRQLGRAEERRLLEAVYDYSQRYGDGEMTTGELRQIAGLGESKSAQTMSSNILARWREQGLVERVQRGRYRFVRRPEKSATKELMDRLEGHETE